MTKTLGFITKFLGNIFSNIGVAAKVIIIIFLALFLGISVWLNQAPREMQFAKPHLVQALSSIFPGSDIEIDNVKLAWPNFAESPKLLANNVLVKTKSQKLNFKQIAGKVNLATITGKNPGLSQLGFKFNDLKDARIIVTGNLNEPKDNTTPIKLNIDIYNFPLSALKNYWPKNYGVKAYTWTSENITGGHIGYGNAKLNFTKEQIDNKTIPDSAVSAKLKVRNGVIRFMKGYKPITKLSGDMQFTAKTMKLKINSARLGASKITSGDMSIKSFDKPVQYMDLSVRTAGDIKDLIEFYLFRKPSKPFVASKDDISGQATSSIKLYLPLLRSLKAEEIKYSISSKIQDVTALKILDYYSASSLSGDIKIDATDSYSAQLQGRCGLLATHPVFNLSKNLSAANLRNMPCNTNINRDENGFKFTSNYGLTNSEIVIPELSIFKPKSQPARLLVDASVDSAGNFAVDRINLKSGQEEILTKLGFYSGAENKLREVVISKVNFGRNSFSGKVSIPISGSSGDSTIVEIKGKRLDLSNLLDGLLDSNSAKKSNRTNSSNYTLSADVGELFYNKNKKLELVKTRLRIDKEGIKSGQVNAYIENSPIDIDIKKVGESRKFKIKSADAGKILRGFGLYNNIVGGKIDINANYNNGEVTGDAKMEDFLIKKAPTFAKILNIASFTGISDTINNKGIRFDKAKTKFKLTKNSSFLDNFVAHGGSIGVTATGSYGHASDRLNFKGTLAPAYALNSIFGNIPIIGEALIGGEGEGLFAVNYSLKGTTKKPNISVNPLSALTPGFLRNIFN